MFLTTHFITFALTIFPKFFVNALPTFEPTQTNLLQVRRDRCLFWLSLCQIKRQEEHLQVVARGTQSQTVNFLNVIALVFCIRAWSIINNKLFLIQFIVNITLVSLHRNSRKRCPKARRISCAGSTVTSWPIFCVFLSLLFVLCVTITRLTRLVVSPLTNSPHPSPMLESHRCHWL